MRLAAAVVMIRAQAQMGHVSPSMMKTYSHIRRKALDGAAKALEPTFALVFPEHSDRPR